MLGTAWDASPPRCGWGAGGDQPVLGCSLPRGRLRSETDESRARRRRPRARAHQRPPSSALCLSCTDVAPLVPARFDLPFPPPCGKRESITGTFICSVLSESEPRGPAVGSSRGGKPWADAGQGQGPEPGSGGTVPEGCCPGGWLVWGERPWGGGF